MYHAHPFFVRELIVAVLYLHYTDVCIFEFKVWHSSSQVQTEKHLFYNQEFVSSNPCDTTDMDPKDFPVNQRDISQ